MGGSVKKGSVVLKMGPRKKSKSNGDTKVVGVEIV